MTVSDLPAFNATLNATATLLLTAGFILIKSGRPSAHRACMTTAIAVSAVFLVTYVLHKILVAGVHTKFGGEGALKAAYYAMLLTHIVLAIAIVPMVLVTFNHARKGRFDRHRRWARITFPIWYYVSVTGVLIYFSLYVWWPADA
jgi:putative membrane protein